MKSIKFSKCSFDEMRCGNIFVNLYQNNSFANVHSNQTKKEFNYIFNFNLILDCNK